MVFVNPGIHTSFVKEMLSIARENENQVTLFEVVIAHHALVHEMSMSEEVIRYLFRKSLFLLFRD